MPSHYSTSERIIARFLSSMPTVKKFAKKIYQYICWFLHKKKYTNESLFLIEIIESNPAHDSFFGYYDKSPVNIDGDHVVYHSSKYSTYKKPNSDIPIEITLQKLSTGKVLLNIPSYAYNWQQGCRTQWLNADFFIFNDFDAVHQRYIARVWSLSSLKEVKTFDSPVQDSYQTDYFLSLNYRRIISLRPDYGYRNLSTMKKGELKNKDNDGIWKIDYGSGETALFASFLSICAVSYKNEFDSAIHKVNHIMISPNGKKFIFLHRYYTGQRRFDRLLLADSYTAEMKVLADYEMVSHCSWINDETILGYLRGPNKKDAYWLIDINTGNFTSAVGGKLDQYGDGHPYVHGDWFVTDTYPDKARIQHLFLGNLKTNDTKEIGDFFHGFKYSGEARCDLHPRMSPDGKWAFIDSVFSGHRKLYRMNIRA